MAMALSPGQTITGLYDYSTTAGAKMYIKSTKVIDLMHYNGSPQGLATFLSRLSRRSCKAGWNNIATVNGHNIYREYGCFTIAEARTEAQTCYLTDAVGQLFTNRATQESAQLMECLMALCDNKMITRTGYCSFTFWYQGLWWIIAPQ